MGYIFINVSSAGAPLGDRRAVKRQLIDDWLPIDSLFVSRASRQQAPPLAVVTACRARQTGKNSLFNYRTLWFRHYFLCVSARAAPCCLYPSCYHNVVMMTSLCTCRGFHVPSPQARRRHAVDTRGRRVRVVLGVIVLMAKLLVYRAVS